MEQGVFEQIETNRLLLRKLRPTDVENYYERLGGSEEVTRYMLWKPHASIQESRESIEKVLKKYRENNGYCWGIALKENDSLIGRVDLLRIDEERKCCSFAYMLGKQYWNRGFGTEVLQGIFSFAFDKLKMQRITADHIRENIASGKAMQKAGMRYVGKQASKYEKNGKTYDADVYMITAQEWN